MSHEKGHLEAARGVHLLDRPIPEDYQQEWTERIAAAQESEAAGTVSVILFRLNLEWLALPTRIFQEAVESYTIRSVPHHRNGTLLGLVNVRGELLLCLDLARLLGPAGNSLATDVPTRQQLLVLNWPGNRIAFPVNEVGGVYRYHPAEMVETPATVARAAGSVTLGVLHAQHRTVGCLDDVALLAAVSRSFV